MENISINEFQLVTSASGAYILLSLGDGQGGRIAAGTFTEQIKPSIQNGVWFIGSQSTGVTAQGEDGKSVRLRQGSTGIEWAYENEENWKVVVPYSELKLDFDDLTEEQKGQLKMTLDDLSAEDIALLQQPAKDMIATLQATNVEMQAAKNDAQDTADHPTYIGIDYFVYKWNKLTKVYEKTSIYVKGEQGEQGEQGVQGVRGVPGVQGEPGQKGEDGLPPTLQLGDVTTLEAGANASAKITLNGTTAEGSPIYKIDLFLPRGAKGDNGSGAGNVLVDASKLVKGKQYVFTPNQNGSAEGRFEEVIVPEIDTTNLATKDELSSTAVKANQAAMDASIAKNAVATLEGLADATTAMETLAGQVVQIEESKQKLSELGSEVMKLEVGLNSVKNNNVEDGSDEFTFSDLNGNVIAKIGKEGIDSQNIRELKNELNSIDKESIKNLKDNILPSNEDTLFTDRYGNVAFCIKKNGAILYKGNSLKWGGKRMLAIGDSITASNQWQTYVGDDLGLSVRTHAKGGIGIIQMVDGDGSGDAPEGYDPDNFGVSTLYALNVEDVKDVDLIVVMGCYNARVLAQTAMGEETDMYPTNNTFCGQMNYLVDRIYSVLSSANNNRCKLVFVSPHKYGYYPYSSLSAYEDGPFIFEGFKRIADRHSIPLIDLMHNAGINKYNWSVYQKSGTSYNSLYVTSDGSANNGINKPFASVNQLPSSAVDGSLATVGTKSLWDVYIKIGGKWAVASTEQAGHYCWYNDQLHLNDEGQHLIAEYISSFINNLK